MSDIPIPISQWINHRKMHNDMENWLDQLILFNFDIPAIKKQISYTTEIEFQVL